MSGLKLAVMSFFAQPTVNHGKKLVTRAQLYLKVVGSTWRADELWRADESEKIMIVLRSRSKSNHARITESINQSLLSSVRNPRIDG